MKPIILWERKGSVNQSLATIVSENIASYFGLAGNRLLATNKKLVGPKNSLVQVEKSTYGRLDGRTIVITLEYQVGSYVKIIQHGIAPTGIIRKLKSSLNSMYKNHLSPLPVENYEFETNFL